MAWVQTCAPFPRCAGKRKAEYRGPDHWAVHSSGDEDEIPDLMSDVTSSDCDSDYEPKSQLRSGE